MLACHRSQYPSVSVAHQKDDLEIIYIQGRFWGMQCGAEYAEGFTQEKVYPRLRTVRLLP